MNKTPFEIFTITFAFLALFGIFIVGAGLGLLIYTGDLYKLDFCFKNECINYFAEQTSSLYSITSNYLALLTFIVTSGGIYIAIKTYINTANTNALNCHISHYNIFSEYINSEIKKLDMIKISSLDVFKWYNAIFPNSRSGSMNVSTNYKETINCINNAIKQSNDEYSQPSHSGFSYKSHQTRMIEVMEKLNIKLQRFPRNDFYLIEKEVIDLIDAVNKAFCSGEIDSLEQREYI
jgi:hypothetical protein